MNNDNNNNNNLNGTVLGNVTPNMPNGETPVNSNLSQNLGTVESLDGSNPVPPTSGVNPGLGTMNNNPINNNLGTGVNPMNNPVPQPTPNPVPPVNNPVEPAYTNPQSIVPNSAPTNTGMPGFENFGTIGTTPPISLDQEPKPKKPEKKNKLGFILIVIIVLAAIGFGTFYVLRYTNLLNQGAINIKITPNNLEINVNDKIPEESILYATVTGTDINNCTIDKTKIDNQKAGTYEFIVTCGETKASGTLTVNEPVQKEIVVALKEVYKTKDDTITVDEFIDNKNEDYTYEFVDTNGVTTNLSEAGEYDVAIKVTSGEESTEVTGKLIVLAYPIKGYLTCSATPQTVTGTSAQMTIVNRFGISANDNQENIYAGLSFLEHTFVFTDETEFTSYQNDYQEKKEITINNITSKNASFDAENLTITLSTRFDNATLYEDYGEDNISTYSKIRNYFIGTLGYTCTYKS